MFTNFFGLSPNMPGAKFMNSYYPIIIAVSIGFFFGIRSYFRGPQCQSLGSLKNKIVIITGASSGIGLEMTKIFSELEAKVYIGCRSKERADEAINEISKLVENPSIHFIPLDLSSLHSVKAFAEAFLKRENKLDILVNNAGVLGASEHESTEDGIDYHFQVNYLGHFLLTHLLLDTLKATPHSRVINNTSHAFSLFTLNLKDLIPPSFFAHLSHPYSAPVLDSSRFKLKENIDNIVEEEKEERERMGDDDGDEATGENKEMVLRENVPKVLTADELANRMNRHYAFSKLSNVFFTVKLAEVLGKKSPVVVVSNPGVVFTDIYKNTSFRQSFLIKFLAIPLMWFFAKTSKDGAQTHLHCATSPEVADRSGKYFIGLLEEAVFTKMMLSFIKNGKNTDFMRVYLKDCAEKELKQEILDKEMIDFLYKVSLKVCHKWLN